MAPKDPPTMEIVAMGFLRRIQEQTVSLLKIITAIASVISKPDATHRAEIPIWEERTPWRFLRGNN
jgi:hypothetical protein